MEHTLLYFTLRHRAGSSQTVQTIFVGRWSRRTEDAVHAVAADSSTAWEGQKIHREEIWRTVPKTLRVAAELKWDISRYPAVSVLLRFCDTSSDHCDTRTILQRTKKYQKLFAVNDGWREANGLAHICINSDISWSEQYDKVIEEFDKFNRRLSFMRFNSQFLRAT